MFFWKKVDVAAADFAWNSQGSEHSHVKPTQQIYLHW